MSTRLAEIKMEHDLKDLDFATMMEAIDDTLPIVLHNGGMSFSLPDLFKLFFGGSFVTLNISFSLRFTKKIGTNLSLVFIKQPSFLSSTHREQRSRSKSGSP